MKSAPRTLFALALAALLALAAAVAEESTLPAEELTLPHPDRVLKKCNVDESPTEDDFRAIFQDYNITDLSQNGKCLAACFFERTGVMQNGEFNKKTALQALKEYLPTDANLPQSPKMLQLIIARYMKGVESCEKDVGVGNERCETGYKILGCVFKYDERGYFNKHKKA